MKVSHWRLRYATGKRNLAGWPIQVVTPEAEVAMNRNNGATGPQRGRVQWGSYGFLAGVVVGLLTGWMFHGFVGTFVRLAIVAIAVVPLVLLFIAWRRFVSPWLRPAVDPEPISPAGAIETRAVVRGVAHEPHFR
jgi:hypothetical protein